MRNAEYWRGRFGILEEAANAHGLEYLETLEREFCDASRTIQADIERWYGRFAENNEITLAEAKRWLNAGQLEEFKWTVQDYIKYGRENALNGQWVKQLENASARVHISRLESLQLQMQQHIEVLYGNHIDGVDGLLRKIYSDGYYHTAFEIERGMNAGWSLHSLNPRQVETVLTKPWSTDMRTFRDRCWTNKAELVTTVRTQLTQAIVRGDPPDKAIKAIADRFSVSKNKAGRLVMTESAYFSAQAQKDCFNELDVEQFEVVGTLDKTTCGVCGALDGKVIPMVDYECGVTAPPFHPWCRCCTAPWVDDNYGERIARDPMTGEVCYVPGDMTYAEWYQKCVVDKYGEDEAALLKRMSANETADREQYAKFKDILGTDAPKNLEDFQRLKYTDGEWWEAKKNGKQAVLNELDYRKSFNGKFGDFEVRSWYDAHDKAIPSKIDTTKSLLEQAKQSHELRNLYKQQARNMMADVEKAAGLDEKRPLHDFDFYFQKYGADENALRKIIESATRPNAQVNKKYGLD